MRLLTACDNPLVRALTVAALLLVAAAPATGQVASSDRSRWIALAKGGFVVPLAHPSPGFGGSSSSPERVCLERYMSLLRSRAQSPF